MSMIESHRNCVSDCQGWPRNFIPFLVIVLWGDVLGQGDVFGQDDISGEGEGDGDVLGEGDV